MIPQGLAAQPRPSTTTLPSAELTGGLEAPSREPTEPASRSGEAPILSVRAWRRSADSHPRAHGACRRGARSRRAYPRPGSRAAEPKRGSGRPRRPRRVPDAAPLVPERRLPLAADDRAVALRPALRDAAPQPSAAVARASSALAGRIAGSAATRAPRSSGRGRLDGLRRRSSSAHCACAARCSCPRARRSPTSPASSSGPTRASTCTS